MKMNMKILYGALLLTVACAAAEAEAQQLVEERLKSASIKAKFEIFRKEIRDTRIHDKETIDHEKAESFAAEMTSPETLFEKAEKLSLRQKDFDYDTNEKLLTIARHMKEYYNHLSVLNKTIKNIKKKHMNPDKTEYKHTHPWQLGGFRKEHREEAKKQILKRLKKVQCVLKAFNHANTYSDDDYFQKKCSKVWYVGKYVAKLAMVLVMGILPNRIALPRWSDETGRFEKLKRSEQVLAEIGKTTSNLLLNIAAETPAMYQAAIADPNEKLFNDAVKMDNKCFGVTLTPEKGLIKMTNNLQNSLNRCQTNELNKSERAFQWKTAEFVQKIIMQERTLPREGLKIDNNIFKNHDKVYGGRVGAHRGYTKRFVFVAHPPKVLNDNGRTHGSYAALHKFVMEKVMNKNIGAEYRAMRCDAKLPEDEMKERYGDECAAKMDPTSIVGVVQLEQFRQLMVSGWQTWANFGKRLNRFFKVFKKNGYEITIHDLIHPGGDHMHLKTEEWQTVPAIDNLLQHIEERYRRRVVQGKTVLAKQSWVYYMQRARVVHKLQSQALKAKDKKTKEEIESTIAQALKDFDKSHATELKEITEKEEAQAAAHKVARKPSTTQYNLTIKKHLTDVKKHVCEVFGMADINEEALVKKLEEWCLKDVDSDMFDNICKAFSEYKIDSAMKKYSEKLDKERKKEGDTKACKTVEGELLAEHVAKLQVNLQFSLYISRIFANPERCEALGKGLTTLKRFELEKKHKGKLELLKVLYKLSCDTEFDQIKNFTTTVSRLLESIEDTKDIHEFLQKMIEIGSLASSLERFEATVCHDTKDEKYMESGMIDPLDDKPVFLSIDGAAEYAHFLHPQLKPIKENMAFLYMPGESLIKAHTIIENQKRTEDQAAKIQKLREEVNELQRWKDKFLGQRGPALRNQKSAVGSSKSHNTASPRQSPKDLSNKPTAQRRMSAQERVIHSARYRRGSRDSHRIGSRDSSAMSIDEFLQPLRNRRRGSISQSADPSLMGTTISGRLHRCTISGQAGRLATLPESERRGSGRRASHFG